MEVGWGKQICSVWVRLSLCVWGTSKWKSVKGTWVEESEAQKLTKRGGEINKDVLAGKKGFGNDRREGERRSRFKMTSSFR